MITANSVSSEEIVINAPAEVVWGVILDFANYGLWNTFCPSMKGRLKCKLIWVMGCRRRWSM